MIEQLAQFVPYAGNTHNLQWRKSPESKWYMDTIRAVNARGERNETTQGFYIIDAAGGAYGWNNNRDLQRVLDFMKAGLESYRAAAPKIDAVSVQDDGIPDPPPGTVVLRIYQRITPLPKGAPPENEAVQRDHFWLLRSEIEALAAGEVAESLQLRLCRFVFNDAVRGEPDMWQVNEVRKRSFKATRAGDSVTIEGSFAMHTDDKRRALQGKLTAKVRLAGDEVADFKGFADATAWGRSTHTPNEPAGKFPIKFAFVMAPKSKDTVAPQATFFGPNYLTGR
ncbi:MAG: hypothetical protein ACR2HJ_02745 [Fimbriimonadales bacterium]